MEARIARRQPQRRRLQTVCAAGDKYASLRRSRAKKPRSTSTREVSGRHAPRRIERTRSAERMNETLKNAFEVNEEDKNVLAGFSAS